ncbi:hypothetical protein CK203_110147 [Vitis vinifera]|uniref:Retrovirus-related Pol polyprotein from transposon RE1 n=1 Tax=Vitis vinifera TaxID=29760 RepID=A0A438CP46_VITVI|nr:hypothetical protein CK203_110147 [Vitis vinifera]
MVVSSNASATFNLPTQVISIKLDGTNFLAWSAQLIPLFRSYGLMGIVDGSNPCPHQYSSDELCDQGVFNSAYALNLRFVAPSTSLISLIKRKLQSLQQSSMSCQSFLDEVKFLSDELSAIGKPVEDSDLILSVLNGLNSSFHSFVTIYMPACKGKIHVFSDFHAELLNYDLMQKFHNHTIQPKTSSYDLYSHKIVLKPGAHSNNINRSRSSGRHPPTELAAMVAEANTTYLNQHQWYADSGNGAGLIISCTGNAIIKTHSSTLALNDVAYCPQASAHLLSINRFGPVIESCTQSNLQQLSSSKFHAFSMAVGVKASTAIGIVILAIFVPLGVNAFRVFDLTCLINSVKPRTTSKVTIQRQIKPRRNHEEEDHLKE